MLVGTASFLVVRLGFSYLALPATGVRGILTQEAIDHEQAVTEAHNAGRSVTVLGGSQRRRSDGHLHGCRCAGYYEGGCSVDSPELR